MRVVFRLEKRDVRVDVEVVPRVNELVLVRHSQPPTDADLEAWPQSLFRVREVEWILSLADPDRPADAVDGYVQTAVVTLA